MKMKKKKLKFTKSLCKNIQTVYDNSKIPTFPDDIKIISEPEEIANIEHHHYYKALEKLGVTLNKLTSNSLHVSFDHKYLAIKEYSAEHWKIAIWIDHKITVTETCTRKGGEYVDKRGISRIQLPSLYPRNIGFYTRDDLNKAMRAAYTRTKLKIKELEQNGNKFYSTPEERHEKRGTIVSKSFGF